MNTQHRMWIGIGAIGLIALMMACVLPSAAPGAKGPTPTATPTSLASTPLPAAGLLAGGSSGGNGSGSGSGGGSGGGNGGGSGASGGNNGGSETVSPTELATTYDGPYDVKQIVTYGGEVISGTVCSLHQPFSVLFTTPSVTFTTYFAPLNSQRGKVSYAYSIPKAGESHDATGTYSISSAGSDGTLQLSLAVSDHVVFKGFDGKIPNRYKFNLVPSGNNPCLPAP